MLAPLMHATQKCLMLRVSGQQIIFFQGTKCQKKACGPWKLFLNVTDPLHHLHLLRRPRLQPKVSENRSLKRYFKSTQGAPDPLAQTSSCMHICWQRTQVFVHFHTLISLELVVVDKSPTFFSSVFFIRPSFFPCQCIPVSVLAKCSFFSRYFSSAFVCAMHNYSLHSLGAPHFCT